MFVAGSTEDLCSFRRWGNVGCLCVLCALPPFFQQPFLPLPPFPSLLLLILHKISLHRLSLFLLTLTVHIQHTMLTMCHARIWLPT